MEYITKGTTLSIRQHWDGTTPSTEPAYKKIYGLYSVPKISGSRELIDVTNLDDDSERGILGIRQNGGGLQFSLYATEGETDTTTQIRDTKSTLLDLEDDLCDFKVEYPDGYGFSWSGHQSVSEDETNVNEACKLTLDVSIETDVVRIVPDSD